MDDTLSILDLDDDAAAQPAAAWPPALMRPSAKLIDCEAWFSEQRLGHQPGAGSCGEDLP
jgi:hypothetical protein